MIKNFHTFVSLKTRSHIFFSLLLLTAMLFTATRNISIGQNSPDKTELAKKILSEGDEKDGAEDESGDDDMDDILNRFFDFDWGMYNIDTEMYDYNNQRYISCTIRKTTPPPKI